MGRPTFQPTDDQRRMVKSMAALGTPQDEIAGVITVSAKTLRRHFRKELDRGATEANAQVGQTMYKMSTSGRFPACTIFWLKCRAGWRQNGGANRNVSDTPPFIVEVVKPEAHA